VFDKYYQRDQSIILVGGHYNNWEIAAISLDLWAPHQAIGIYSPLSNKFFDNKLAQSRTRYGVRIIPKAQVLNSFIENRDKVTMTVFGADQSPTYSRKVHWTTFLNQETAVHIGTELFALKYNYPILFIKIHKVKRGFYQAEIEELTNNSSACDTGEISELHTRCLEKMIIEKPQYWLWSHKRWKRKKTEEERKAEVNVPAA
jgi:KDO2-lipid IV(A) lauroyltransferase